MANSIARPPAARQDGFDLQWSLVHAGCRLAFEPDRRRLLQRYVTASTMAGSPRSCRLSTTILRRLATLDGNLAANRVADITHTVSGINWAPGTQLWIRWRDQFTHDGIAIDNVRFTATAVPEPSAFLLLASALLCCVCRRQSRRRE